MPTCDNRDTIKILLEYMATDRTELPQPTRTNIFVRILMAIAIIAGAFLPILALAYFTNFSNEIMLFIGFCWGYLYTTFVIGFYSI